MLLWNFLLVVPPAKATAKVEIIFIRNLKHFSENDGKAEPSSGKCLISGSIKEIIIPLSANKKVILGSGANVKRPM